MSDNSFHVTIQVDQTTYIVTFYDPLGNPRFYIFFVVAEGIFLDG